MVAGSYGVNPDYDAALAADEDANYNRRDFTPSTGTAASTAFLVRMRRTNNANGLDQEAGVSSAGPHAADFVRPRKHDGAERQWQQHPVERIYRHHRPRHGNCRPSARQERRPGLLDYRRHRHRPACSLRVAKRSLGKPHGHWQRRDRYGRSLGGRIGRDPAEPPVPARVDVDRAAA